MLVERGLVVERTAGPAARVLDVGQVADLLGRKPAWVYAHAAELGAFRFGDGPKARLGFDVSNIETVEARPPGRPGGAQAAASASTISSGRPGGETHPVRDSRLGRSIDQRFLMCRTTTGSA